MKSSPEAVLSLTTVTLTFVLFPISMVVESIVALIVGGAATAVVATKNNNTNAIDFILIFAIYYRLTPLILNIAINAFT